MKNCRRSAGVSRPGAEHRPAAAPPIATRVSRSRRATAELRPRGRRVTEVVAPDAPTTMARNSTRKSGGTPKPALPDYAHVVRGLPPGMHRYLELLPRAAESPGMVRVAADPQARARLLATAQVRIEQMRSFCWVDIAVPCIVLSQDYYREGSTLDLYLDLLHELTHVRQVGEGRDVWDEAYEYVDRPTEIEAYAVAVSEGRRLGMTDAEVVLHLSNPWMSSKDVQRLVDHIEALLAPPPPVR
jgi:hypothetical protein